jgi:HSP20 family protein
MKIILHNGEVYIPFYRTLNASELRERLSREIWDSWSPFTTDMRLVPDIDIHEEKGQVVVKAELPGIDKKDLDISLEGTRLTIKAGKKEKTEKQNSRRNRETYSRQYFHSVTLPYPVKEAQAVAKFNKGVLELRLPKDEEVKPIKIEIKAQLPKGETKNPGPRSDPKKS